MWSWRLQGHVAKRCGHYLNRRTHHPQATQNARQSRKGRVLLHREEDLRAVRAAARVLGEVRAKDIWKSYLLPEAKEGDAAGGSTPSSPKDKDAVRGGRGKPLRKN